MGVSVALSETTLDVVPGEEAVCTATVRNTGAVIDQISFDVVGPAAAWSVIEPPVLNLYPGDSGQVRVHFRPPRASEPNAGPSVFGLRASSLEDPRGSSTEEGTVVVAPFTDLRVTLLPQISRGGRRGRHKIDVSNLGNVPVGTEISAVDPDDALTFTVARPAAVAQPGLVTQTRIVAVPRQKFWTGKQKIRPFQVVVQPERGTASTVDGTFEQEPLVPRWALASAIALLVLAMVLAGMWFAIVRPAIKSSATEAAKVEASKAAAIKKAEDEANGGAGGPKGTGEDVTPTLSPSPAVSVKPANPADKPLIVPISFQIVSDAAVRTTGFSTTTNPDQKKKPLAVTDLQLQNPNGDVGSLQIRRGTTVLYSAGLENFRDFPQPYVTALQFKKGEELVLAIQCHNPLPEKKHCTAAVTVSGKTTT
jgi:hypothetical protein